MASIKSWFCLPVATFLGLGYSPIAPGTVGSVGAFFLVFFWFPGTEVMQAIWALAAIALGFLSCGVAVTHSGKKDPSEVVIDEVAGVFITFLWLPQRSLWVLMAGLILFRIFDIWKPWLVGKADQLKGVVGIMLDDIIAGIFANLLLQILLRVIL